MGLGDEVMVTGDVREMYAREPRRVKIVYEKGRRWCPLWENNPKIAHPADSGNFQTLRPRENYLRPYCAEKTPTRWTWKPYRPPRGEIYLTRGEQEFASRYADAIVLGHHVKPGASPNKRWSRDSWTALAEILLRAGRLIELGDWADPPLPGVERVRTGIREAAAVLSRAKLVVCSEGATHHIAAAFRTPTVVIFGGYISPACTGYEDQTSIFIGDDLGCGMRIDCKHCADAMAAITPERVAEAARARLC